MRAANREASKKLFRGKFGKGGLFGGKDEDGKQEDATAEENDAAQSAPVQQHTVLAALFAWLMSLLQGLLGLVGLGGANSGKQKAS